MKMNETVRIPRHVSIIMDGNGRWAEKRGKERVFGHAEGIESVRACVEAAAEFGVEYLSLFAFSEENWARPEPEVEALMGLMMKAITGEIPSLKEKGVKLVFLGNLGRLAPELRDAAAKAEEETEPADGAKPVLTLVVFISYSGKWDILQAARKSLSGNGGKAEELTAEDFESHLVTAGIPDPDLVVRTSGERRISNYLLWQAAYSEFYFTETLWPDFRREEFRLALEEYSRRDRRYGKVK